MLVNSDKYKIIFKNYEKIAKQESQDARRVGWNNEERAEARYQYILDQLNTILIESDINNANLLDIGCGLCILYSHIKSSPHCRVNYQGIDISEYYISQSARIYPEINLLCCDILENSQSLIIKADITVLNGVFTQRFDLDQAEMDEFLINMISEAKKSTKKLMLFNVMSPYVDFRLEGSYHVEYERMIEMMRQVGVTNVEIDENIVPYEYFVRAYV